MTRKKYSTVPEFIADCPKDTQRVLKKLRVAVKAAIPKAEETISYNIPCYKINGKYVIYFAGYTRHVSIYPIPKDIAAIKTDIEKYKAGKGTLRFPLNKPLPIAFIKKVAKQLAKQIK